MRGPARTLSIALALGAATLASGLAVVACDDDGEGQTQCLGGITPTSAEVPVGGSLVFSITEGNPDDDNGGASSVVWTVSGGGQFDQTETTLLQSPQTDQFGYPAGSQGATTNTYRPVTLGTYQVQANVSAAGGCNPLTLNATVVVVASDAGPSEDAAADAGDDGEVAEAGNAATADAASDGATPDGAVDGGSSDGATE